MKNLMHGAARGAAALSVYFLAGCLSDNAVAPQQDANEVKTAAATAATLHPLGLKKDNAAMMSSRTVRMFTAGAPALPASVDLSRYAPPVGDQGFQGSCVGWASTTAKSIQESMEEGWNPSTPLHRFAPASVYNLINGGVDNGAFLSDAMNLLTSSGADAEYFFPYNQFNYTTQRDYFSNTRSQRYVDNGWASLGSSVQDIKAALSQNKPVMFGIAVYPDWDNLNAANPIYNTTAGAYRGLHAITCVGYDDSKQAFKVLNSWGTVWGLSGYGWVAYSLLADPNLVFSSYVLYNGTNAHGWYKGYHERTTGDVNGDGKKDFIGMGSDGVEVALSNGSALGGMTFWNTNIKLRALNYKEYVPDRRVGDVNGDGKADIVSFGDGQTAGSDPVLVSLSTGTSFSDPTTWLAPGFCHQSSYVNGFSRQVADMNGDGKADLLGFCMDGVYVSFSTGTSFQTPVRWSFEFSYGNGFNEQYTRISADVNGDKKSDIVVFGDFGYWVELSTGSGFAPNQVGNEFGWTAGWDANTVKTLADVNGDGKADIVAYGYNSVRTALSTGSNFAASTVWTSLYGYNGGYQGNAVKLAADVSGDKKADLVITNFNDTHVAKSSGTAFGGDATWLAKSFGSSTNEWFQP